MVDTNGPVSCPPMGSFSASSSSASPMTPPFPSSMSCSHLPTPSVSPLLPRGTTNYCAPFAPLAALSSPSSADPSIQNMYQSPYYHATMTPPSTVIQQTKENAPYSSHWAAAHTRHRTTSTGHGLLLSTPPHSPNTPQATLASMFSDMPGCKRKRSVQDFGGISMDCILAATGKGEGKREVISRRRVRSAKSIQQSSHGDDSSHTGTHSAADADVAMACDDDEDESDDDDDIEFCFVAI